LMRHNIQSVYSLVQHVAKNPAELRMVRISSDLLPGFTEPNWRGFWHQADVQDYAEAQFRRVGDLARMADVRLSFHPGQFCVLGSDKDDVVNRSIEDFEYHATMCRWMGYGKSFQDFKINVHIAGRAGPEGVRRSHAKLSPEARNCITIENEEITWGLEDCLTLSDLVPIVLDIHHHWVKTGEYIRPEDLRVQRVRDSWRGVRPAMHYSLSREDVLVGHCRNTMPNHAQLLTQGFNKSKLRAHSDMMWNRACNRWALEHNDWADIVVEAKSKNLASHALLAERVTS
jgi:UV DNA damage endonuclease